MSYKLIKSLLWFPLTINQTSLILQRLSCPYLNNSSLKFIASQRRMVGSQSPKPKKSSVYTRTGDKGYSSLYSGEKRPKYDDIFHALGTVDELNSIGNELDKNLVEIQCRLIEIGSSIATPRSTSNENKLSYTSFDEENVSKLEFLIDDLDSKLPSLNNFILPSGGESAVFLHQCRSICRRAERITIPLMEKGITENTIGKYLNRLSDYFFVAARYAAMYEGQTENIYIQRRTDKPSELLTRELKKD
ncbi:10429_t:CDS:2 [Diversispora eburnea]|uniref:Corrinoid adenosyltransferase MMAB n=1 Tax=Diversispora eburnea TaxID=1213867 RepID=A0A9N8V0C3_9GLOM|nr:10429_t:CDS:2 [Diversispora eburnea]